MTKDEALDKKADNAMIYKTFEQWMNGDFLEVGEPRKKAYSEDELLLVEMGWNYGYDAGLERLAELVRADAIANEREACAKVCEEYETNNDITATWLNIVAEAIRNRSNT